MALSSRRRSQLFQCRDRRRRSALASAGCQPAVRGSLSRTDLELTLGSRKEDIRRSGRMQQAGSLRSPEIAIPIRNPLTE